MFDLVSGLCSWSFWNCWRIEFKHLNSLCHSCVKLTTWKKSCFIQHQHLPLFLFLCFSFFSLTGSLATSFSSFQTKTSPPLHAVKFSQPLKSAVWLEGGRKKFYPKNPRSSSPPSWASAERGSPSEISLWFCAEELHTLNLTPNLSRPPDPKPHTEPV